MISDRRQNYLILNALHPSKATLVSMETELAEHLKGFEASEVAHPELAVTVKTWFLTPSWMRSTAVLSLVIVAALTAVAGFIYLIIYFKSIKPLTARTSRYCRNKMIHHHHKNADDEVNQRLRSTHPFFRRT